ncbi:Cytochrome P450 monooxygenase FUS8 [Hyphodiscus hymeniophilus]|uniref:Cytochrome P450 monooxygenase FUS8 n=1 Tax=Hyphodiscus hymeniophilus TaxID=353542 RepID=A0A9P7AW13_9HELO|nr:Cytochrome P450 monooxygenase FUS8 [Hyphodiscus hymeniophilus]
MYSYTTVLLYLVLAEVLRRCCKMLLTALTGPLAKVPGPWLLKFTLLPWRKVILQGNQVNVTPKLFAKYGDVVRIGPNEVAVASKNSCYKVIVEDDLRKSPAYASLNHTGVTNLITERDNTAYKQKIFIEALTKKCDECKGSADVDFSRLLANLTFDVMSATSFGGSFDLTRTEDTKMRKAFHTRLIKAALNSQMPWLKYIPFAPNPASPEMDEMIATIVSNRRKALEAGQEKKDLLQIFLDTHDAHPDEFTMEHIYDEMRLFMIAGSDTTSATAQFTIILLLNNPAKMKLLLEEIDTSFPNMDDEITFAATQSLPYLNACINESMRVMPIVRTGIPRIAEQATVLDGYEIPSGTLVTAYIDAMMRDSRVWSEANQYVPERWLQGEVDRKAFLPFSGGLRNCIGQQLPPDATRTRNPRIFSSVPSNMSYNKEKKPVIAVVGAGPGIGEAVARRFVAEGYVVALLARTEDKLQTMGKGIDADFGSGSARHYITDLRVEAQVISSFQSIRNELGPVQVLVYNAGARRVNGRSVLDTTTEEFEGFTRINLFGAFWASKCVLPDMLAAEKGTIIFTGATGSLRGMPGLSSFSPGKFGLRSLAQVITREYQGKGIHTAHLIIDGPVDGKLIGGVRRRQWQREGAKEILEEIDMHLMQPNDLAQIYWYLHTQPRSAWTQELDVRAQKETMFSKL